MAGRWRNRSEEVPAEEETSRMGLERGRDWKRAVGQKGDGGDRSGCVEPGCGAAQSGRAGLDRGETEEVKMVLGKEGAQSYWAMGKKPGQARRAHRVSIDV